MNMHVEQTSYIGNVKYSDCFKNLLELILPEVCIIKKFSCSELAFHFKVKLFFERLEIQMQNGRSTSTGSRNWPRRRTSKGNRPKSERIPSYESHTQTHTYFGKSGGTQVWEDKRARRRGVTRRGASPLLQRNVESQLDGGAAPVVRVGTRLFVAQRSNIGRS